MAPAAFAAVLLLVGAARGGQAQALSDPLPLDPAIRTGTLDNGLQFFIRRNGRPEDRAMLRLAVRAGSIDEADDQRGLAHVLEHMAFNGTTRFKPGELVTYLESIGARFGPHVNAYTSYDETVYMLDVPTDRDGVLRRGFEALADFAGGITLDPDEIDRERGVVIEEWRGRQGAATRMQAPQIAALFGNSRYAERLPIGTPEILRTFPPERLRDFYREHYRPDRMAVIVAGDIDPAAIETLVREHFGVLRSDAAAARPLHEIPPHAETRYAVVADREAQSSSVSVLHKRPVSHLRTFGDYREALVRSLMHRMVNSRFAEIARQPTAPFLGASTGDETLGRTLEAFTVAARVKDGALEPGLRALAEEMARVRQHGFGEAELERSKRSIMAGYERAFNERDKSESGSYAFELLRHYLEGEAAPGIEVELELVRRFLPTITAVEVGALARTLLTEENRVVLATSPAKDDVALVTEAALREAWRAGLSATVAAWSDEMTGRELLPKTPPPGRVRARREIPEIGTTVVTLSNGVEVWMKPTDFRNDQILFSSYARGGLSLASPEDYQNASLATALVGIAGVGGFSPVELGKLLAGSFASVSASITSATQGVSGSTTPKDLETAMQLLHLQFTAPNKDRSAFELMTRRLEASLANQGQSPGSVFGERVRRLNTMDHYTARPLRLEDLPRLDPERMIDFYQQRFANASDFTFFFVGSFQVDELIPLLETYVGSLPSRDGARSEVGGLRLEFPAATVRETVHKGQEPRSQTIVTFFADTGLDEFETHRLQAATSVLEMRLRDILRERLGGTYSVGVGYSSTSPVPGYGTVAVQFGSAPENVEALVEAVMAEIERLRREGPSPADVRAVKETEKNELQTAMRQNNYWLNSLQAMHLLARDARRIPQRLARTESLSEENIHAAFRKYFPAERHTVVTLMPESSSQERTQ